MNIANEYIKFCEKNITNYLSVLLKTIENEEIIKDYIAAYMDVRYFNPDNIKKIDKTTLEVKYPEYQDFVDALYYLTGIIYALDNITNVEEIKDVISSFEIKVGVKNELEKLVKNNLKKRDKLLTSFSSPDFDITFTNTSVKDLFKVTLIHNIKFDPLFSDVSINKVFNSGVVSEDKLFVLYHMVSNQVLQDIIAKNLKKKYMIPIESTLFQKEKKLSGLLKAIDNDIIKDRVSITVTYKEFLDAKEIILSLKREGYNFAVIIDDVYEDNIANKTRLKIFKYILLEKKSESGFKGV